MSPVMLWTLLAVLFLAASVSGTVKRNAMRKNDKKKSPSTELVLPAAKDLVVDGEELFRVTLFGSGHQKVLVMKVLRDVSPELGVKEAKALVESAPTIVLAGLSRTKAEAARRALAMAGALVAIE